MEGEPEWMIETALRRKREELARKWEEREAQLERIRARERLAEEKGRGAKRQRVGDGEFPSRRGKAREADEEAEFLIDDWEGGDSDIAPGDPLGMLSKETRELMAKVGLGGAKRLEEEEGEVEDEIKVWFMISRWI